ncbi:MAG TPA: poly-gamma-glutamate hydrolase family protein [Syntrophomonadaceae bacterium]|nr:poly-gamma-glutamate hydrolase family protein [Syntrophomonadaceae bacterium]
MRKVFKVISTVLLTVLLIPLFWVGTAQADVYSNYRQLASKQTENKDYRITSYDGPSSTAVIAIHGGKIEIGTCQLAKSVAKKTNSDLYTFEGIKKSNNNILHITSSKFNEPIGKKLVAKSKKTLSIHGCQGSISVTYVGGLDKKLGSKVKAELKKAGFSAVNAPKRLAGTHPNNICNKNLSKKGVQIELTYKMRQSLLKDKKLYSKYVNALCKAL